MPTTSTTKNQRFALDMVERTIRTFLQGFLSVVTLDALSTGVTLDLQEKLTAGLLAGVFAVLTALAAKPWGADDSASVLPENVDPPQ